MVLLFLVVLRIVFTGCFTYNKFNNITKVNASQNEKPN